MEQYKQYIDKSALVAEIEKRIKELQDLFKENEKKLDSFQKTAVHLCIDECKVILNILDTLKVKEVDVKKEFDKCCENYIFDDECEVYIARHFFELGLKAQKGE